MSRFGKGHLDKKGGLSGPGSGRPRAPLPERANLVNYRVVQRDLVYVIGIPVEIAQESILEKYEYFGQYGPIKKIVVNSSVHQQGYQRPTVSAFVTFCKIEDALECIYSLESFTYNNHPIKASLGTSKYCSNFLFGQKCNNQDCMYLHHNGDPKDSFTTEEIQANSPRFTETTRPTRPPDYNKYPLQNSKETVFPPRRILNIQISDSEDSQPEEEYIEEEDEEEIHEEEEPDRSDFLKDLYRNGFPAVPPLHVDYSVNMSLMQQLNLDRDSIRSYLHQK